MRTDLIGKRVYIIGIGGTGMSPIALVLKEMGLSVSGSDRAVSDTVRSLEKHGIPVHIGHAAENVAGADLIVYSSAIGKENPELAEAEKREIPAQKRVDFLDSILSGREVIAIAGTHGKTTTTSMLAWILKSLGTAPGFIIGSTPKDLGKNAEAGTGPLFVIEADEYDRMFLGLHPAVAVVTKIEHDHPDCYPTETDYITVFNQFLENTRENGCVLLNADDPKQVLLTGTAAGAGTVLHFGLVASADFRAENLNLMTDGCYEFDFADNQSRSSVHVQMAVNGRHNVYNALAALSVCAIEDLDLEQAAGALKDFHGIERRFERIAEWNDILIIDDYAHHPTEIKTTLAAARDAFPGRRIWALWQPHTFSRTQTLLNDFCHAFSDCDRLLVTDIYASREKQKDFGFAELKTAIGTAYPEAIFAGSNREAEAILKNELRPGDVVITLSAGDANRIGPAVLAELKTEATAAFHQKYADLIRRDVPLSTYSKALCGGPAKELLIAETVEALIDMTRFYQKQGARFQVCGGLTNLLFSDAGFDGVIILNRAAGIRVEKTMEGAAITADSGTPLIEVVKTCAETGLEGYEWAYGIPGTFGGAIYGNAGAFGSETANIIASVKFLRNNDEIIVLKNEDIGFSYRSSGFKRHELHGTILSATFSLRNGDPAAVKEKMEQIIAKRRTVHPEGMGSLGSVFRNPPEEYAGKLITNCGLRGKRIGKAFISLNHGNTIITEPGVASADYLALVRLAQKEVKVRFGIDLIPEIEILS